MASTEQRRILMLIPHLGPGGAEGAFSRLADQLARQADVTIALMAPDHGANALVSFRPADDLPIILLDGLRDARGSFVRKIARWYRMLVRLRSLKHDHDVTISFLSGANLLNALAGPKRKTIVSERGSKRHDIGMTKRQRALWTQILDPLIYRRAASVVAASEGLAREITAANPAVRAKVIAIEGTIRAERLISAADLPAEAAVERLAEFETVVSFGRFHVQKGYDFLLQAFARVRVERSRARLLLIGDGPETARLRAIADQLGLSHGGPGEGTDVVFTGMRSEPLRYARIGRVFVLPSRYEGLPNALIEALATGVPVMASDCPWGPRSILSGGKLSHGQMAPLLPAPLPYGLLMPIPEGVGALTTWVVEIVRALETPRARVGRDERLRAISQYDIERTGPLWRRLVDETACSAPATAGNRRL